MSIPFLTSIDLTKNELLNFAIQKLATAPANPVESQIYYNSTDKCLYQYNGTAWIRVGVIYDMSLGAVASNTVPLKLIGSDGTTDTVSIKGAGGATLSVSGNTLTITTANTNTTYTFTSSTAADKFTITITPSSGTATTITVPLATASIAGLMSPTQFSKLAGIADGANKTTVDSALSDSSTNPVQNKVVKAALDKKIGTSAGVLAAISGTALADTYSLSTLFFDGSDADTINIPAATESLAGLMLPAQVTKLKGLSNYSHPTGDGNLHVPATGTGNNGKVLKAGGTAGSISWASLSKSDVGLGNVDNTSDANKPVSTAQKAALDLKAPLASPAFTGKPTAPTPTTDTGIANKKYVDDSIANGIAASDAMIFKGTIGTGGNVTALPTTYKTGWTYRVITAGTYAGNVCEVGDLIIALVDRAGSGNANSDWTVAQTNINGAITSIGANSPISVSGSGASRTISHANSGVTAGTYGNVTNSTLKIPKVVVNATGHVTSVSEQTRVVPLVKTYTITAGQTYVRDTATQATLCGYVARDANSGEQLFIDCVNDPVIPAVEFSIASAYANDIIITASYLSEAL